MKYLLLIFFILIVIFSIVFILVINDYNDKEHTKYHGFDIFYDTNLEKHRKIIKLQKKLLLKKQMNLFFKKGECVCSNSFHGIAFSIIFKKEF